MKRVVTSFSAAVFALTVFALTHHGYAQEPPPFKASNVAGRWRFEQVSTDGTKRTGVMTLQQNGNSITGRVILPNGIAGNLRGSVNAQTVSFTVEYVAGKSRARISTWYQGALNFDGRAMEHGTFEARRSSSSASQTGTWQAAR